MCNGSIILDYYHFVEVKPRKNYDAKIELITVVVHLFPFFDQNDRFSQKKCNTNRTSEIVGHCICHWYLSISLPVSFVRYDFWIFCDCLNINRNVVCIVCWNCALRTWPCLNICCFSFSPPFCFHQIISFARFTTQTNYASHFFEYVVQENWLC